MNKKVWKIVAALFVILLASVYYYSEVNKNWEALSSYTYQVRFGYLCLALCLFVLAYLLDVYIWRLCLDSNERGRKVSHLEIVSVMGISDLLRYIPGRIWGVSSQYFLLKKYRISKSEIIYINLICMIGSISVSAYLGLAYCFFYTNFISSSGALIGLVAILFINSAYIFWNSLFINKVIVFLNSFFKFNLQSFSYSRRNILKVQIIYVLSALLAAVSGYCLLRGVALPVSSGDMLVLLSSINISWLVSHFAVIAPRGLGVREGTMLLMLNTVVAAETALLFPVLFRVMISVVDLLFVVFALCLGVSGGAFTGSQTEPGSLHGSD